MVLDKKSTEASIKGAKQSNDKEIDETFTDANLFQLRLEQERNRHKEAMKGRLGLFFGDHIFAATFVAMIAMFFGIVGAAYCVYVASENPDMAEFWMSNFKRSIAFATAALAFIFGKSSAR